MRIIAYLMIPLFFLGACAGQKEVNDQANKPLLYKKIGCSTAADPLPTNTQNPVTVTLEKTYRTIKKIDCSGNTIGLPQYEIEVTKIPIHLADFDYRNLAEIPNWQVVNRTNCQEGKILVSATGLSATIFADTEGNDGALILVPNKENIIDWSFSVCKERNEDRSCKTWQFEQSGSIVVSTVELREIYEDKKIDTCKTH